jgi:tetratricopeptide (TPR) repeat protein
VPNRLGKTAGLDQALTLIVSASHRKPSATAAGRLNALFDDLSRTNPLRDPHETMELIWSIWIDHRDDYASERMSAACQAMAAGARDLARPILDELVRDYPEWAEAWNKRATLEFLERNDSDSLSDITKTLQLEPRHFGAILGFAQICLRNKRIPEAKAAFQIAMELNPHIVGISDIVTSLDTNRRRLH